MFSQQIIIPTLNIIESDLNDITKLTSTQQCVEKTISNLKKLQNLLNWAQLDEGILKPYLNTVMDLVLRIMLALTDKAYITFIYACQPEPFSFWSIIPIGGPRTIDIPLETQHLAHFASLDLLKKYEKLEKIIITYTLYERMHSRKFARNLGDKDPKKIFDFLQAILPLLKEQLTKNLSSESSQSEGPRLGQA